MKKSEVLRNEAAVMLAAALEQASNGASDFNFAETADKITHKMMEAAEAYVWELQDE